MTDLDARYGRRSRRTTVIAVAATAAVAAAAAIAWLLWARPIDAGPRAEWRDTSYAVLGDDRVRAGWELTVEPGTPTECAVYAMNQAFGIVGWKVVPIPASDDRIRRFEETVLTSEPAVTGLIYRCWLA